VAIQWNDSRANARKEDQPAPTVFDGVDSLDLCGEILEKSE
jgi:hypothetical protein